MRLRRAPWCFSYSRGEAWSKTCSCSASTSFPTAFKNPTGSIFSGTASFSPGSSLCSTLSWQHHRRNWKEGEGKSSFPSQERTHFCLLPATVDCCLLREGWTRLRVSSQLLHWGGREACKCSVAFSLAMFLGSSHPWKFWIRFKLQAKRFIYEMPSLFRHSRPYISQPESQGDIHVETLSQLEIPKDNLEPTGASFPTCNFSNTAFAHILHEPVSNLHSAYAESHSPHPSCSCWPTRGRACSCPTSYDPPGGAQGA